MIRVPPIERSGGQGRDPDRTSFSTHSRVDFEPGKDEERQGKRLPERPPDARARQTQIGPPDGPAGVRSRSYLRSRLFFLFPRVGMYHINNHFVTMIIVKWVPSDGIPDPTALRHLPPKRVIDHRGAAILNTDHPNSLLILQCWQAASVGDADTLRAIFATDICWHATSSTPWQGDYTGHDAVLEYLAGVGERSGSYNLTLESAIANDLFGAIVCQISSTLKSKTLRSGMVLLGRFQGKKVSEVWTLSLEPKAVENFWADVPSVQPE